MPTYDYECSGCGHRHEVFERVDAPHLKTCPKCKRRKSRRMPGVGAGVVFKGSGFHATDYARGAGGDPHGRKKETPPAAGDSGKEKEPEAAKKKEKK